MGNNKRMFTGKITDSDAFLDMPHSAQALYFQLNMDADDDGVVSSPKMVMRKVRAADDDLNLLIIKRFVLVLPNNPGIVVIKHWWMHNTLRADRYKPSVYSEDVKRLGIKENKAYTDAISIDWQPSGNQAAPQYRLEEISIDKESIEEVKEKKKKFTPPTLDEVLQYTIEKKMYFNAEAFYHYYNSKGWKVGKNPMVDWHSSIGGWYSRFKEEKGEMFSWHDCQIDYIQRTGMGMDDDARLL